MSRYDEKKQLKCSFCGKSQEQVKRLVAGPGVYICDECIELCSEIIEEEFEEARSDTEFSDIPKPKEIKEILDQYVSDRKVQKRLLLSQSTITISVLVRMSKPEMWRFRKAIL